MSELAAVLAAQKKRSDGESAGPGSAGKKKACDNYRVDLTGDSFGVCVCGFPKAEHVVHQAFGSRQAKPFAVKHEPHKPLATTHAKPKPKPATHRPVPTLPKHKTEEKHVHIPRTVPTPAERPNVQHKAGTSEEYEAVYAFSSTRDGDLTFEVGQVITDVKPAKPGWLSGVIMRGGVKNEGCFPEDFVKKTLSSSTKSAPRSVLPTSTATAAPPRESAPTEPRRTSVKDLQAKFAKTGVAPMPKAATTHAPSHSTPQPAASAFASAPKPQPPRAAAQKSVRELQQVIQASVGKPPAQKEAASSPRRFKGMFDFMSGEAGDLPFKKGDVITLVQEMDENWIECKDSAGRQGLVPLDYVQELPHDPPPSPPTPTHHQPPPSPPSSPFSQPPVSPSSSHASPPPPSTPKIEKKEPVPPEQKLAVALYDFDPQQPEDIRLRKDDIVKVRSEIDDQWWEGVVLTKAGEESGTSGVFPQNFVRALTPSEASQHLPGQAAAASPVKGELQPNGMYKVSVPREFTKETKAPPIGEWYSGKDTYTCQASLQSSLGNTVKTERYHIHRGDRSQVMLAIVQAAGQPHADLEYKIIPFEPLGEEVLAAAAAVYGPKILQYAASKLGGRDGNGECWTLAKNALTYAGAQQALGFNFGQEVSVDKLMPGDVLQFKSCVFHFPGGSKTAGSPDHTAIVKNRISGNNFEVYEQNPNPVTVGSYDLDNVSSGEWKGYRPIPKPEDVKTVVASYKQQAARASAPPMGKPLPPLPGMAPGPPGGPAPPPPPRSSLVKKIALYDFAAQESGDLGLKKGQIVVVTEDLGDWCEGYIEGTNESGQFPTAYVGDVPH